MYVIIIVIIKEVGMLMNNSMLMTEFIFNNAGGR